jgi:hypothetical protein
MQECQLLYGENVTSHDIRYRRKNKSSCHCLCFLLLLHMHVRIGMFVHERFIAVQKERKKILSIYFIVFFLFLSVAPPSLSTLGHNSQLSRSSFRISFRVLIQNGCHSSLLFPHWAAYEIRTSLNTSEYISSVVQCEISTMI